MKIEGRTISAFAMVFTLICLFPRESKAIPVQFPNGRVVEAEPTEYGFDVYEGTTGERIAEIFEDQPGSYLVRTKNGDTRVPIDKSDSKSLKDEIGRLVE